MSQGSKSRYRLVKRQPRQQMNEERREVEEHVIAEVREEITKLRRRGVIPDEIN